MKRILFYLAMIAFLVACSVPTTTPAPTAAPAPQPTSVAPTAAPTSAAPAVEPTTAATSESMVENTPIAGGPTLLRDGIDLRMVVEVESGSIRLAQNPQDGALYLLSPNSGLARVKLQEPAKLEPVAPVSDMLAKGAPTGMAFGPDGTLYLVGNSQANLRNTGIIRRGRFDDQGKLSWETLATSEPYPLSGTPFDHQFNGIVVSPDGKHIYVNSGSRTDHGEVETNNSAFPNIREVPLTSKVFRLPADATDLLLPNDEAGLQPYIFASGTRNAYDLAFAPDGKLFAVDNGPDADYPDEINWLREGQHYGFPWRFGAATNPQTDPNYDGKDDKLLQPDFTAVRSLTYRNDPEFPPAPAVEFVLPIRNLGPAAAQYRDADGNERDAAAEGSDFYGVTPHRSPLGLVFAADEAMPAAWRSTDDMLSAFVLSWGAAGGDLSDAGQDLLHMQLRPDPTQEQGYMATTQQIALDFANPIDAVLIGDTLYVLEFGQDSAIWALRFVE
jgi:glucose/arabinose dehydrogenase